jgi:hypothetical protein
MPEPKQLINRYFQLAPASDTDGYFAQFATDAVVEDEGREYHGIEAIRGWRTSVPSVAYALRDLQSTDDEHTALAEISGEFPGSPVTLAFRFRFAEDGHIRSLTIRA